MIRKALTILSLIGLLLSVGLWGASYFRVAINLPFAAEPIWLLQACVYWSPDYVGCDRADDHEDMGPPQPINWLEIHGFEGFQTQWWTGRWPWPLSPIGETHVPLWIPTVAFATGSISFISIPFHRRRKRKKLGLCLKCGYDLRGSKDRCPECGTISVTRKALT